MTEESACRSPIASETPRVESIPFAEIPGQSKLFLQYQKDAEKLRAYYPNAVDPVAKLADQRGDVLAEYSCDRGAVADALTEIANDIGGSEKTLAAIEKFRDGYTVAVLTGQQTGLFTGPLYTIYKALSAIEAARELSEKGTPAVAIFWAATDDHDLEEVASAGEIDASGELSFVDYSDKEIIDGLPVGTIGLSGAIERSIKKLNGILPATEFTRSALAAIEESWRPGERFGTAFLRQLAELFADHGLIFADPRHASLKKLAAPFMANAVREWRSILPRLIERSEGLVTDGYHAQVLVEDDHVPIFREADDSRRVALRLRDDGFRTKDGLVAFTPDELEAAVLAEPERFSPAVMLRPVVQDYLFPTIAYFGGGAEIAYFAQSAVVYQGLGRRATAIFHRQSFTILEAKHRRTMEKYGLTLRDIFRPEDEVRRSVVESTVGRDAALLFADVEEKINTELRRLDEYFAAVDPTLVDALATRRRKILYHIAALRDKAYRAELRRDADADRRLSALFAALYPAGGLQERSVNVLSFTSRYGKNFLDWICRSTDLDDRGHRVIYL